MWISVEDRLPEKRGNYLVVYKNHPTGPLAYDWNLIPQIASYYGEDAEGTYFEDECYGFEHKDITHWMPLPEPPTEPSR